MVKYNLVVDNYQLEFKNVYFDEDSQMLRNGLFTMAKNIPIELLKNFIRRSFKQALNVNTELEESLLKDSFNEYIEYYKILDNELAKKRILEKLGTYLLLSEKLRGSFWINSSFNNLGANENLELQILKLLSNKLKKVKKNIPILKEDNKINLEIGFSILDIIYDNIGVYNDDIGDLDLFLND